MKRIPLALVSVGFLFLLLLLTFTSPIEQPSEATQETTTAAPAPLAPAASTVAHQSQDLPATADPSHEALLKHFPTHPTRSTKHPPRIAGLWTAPATATTPFGASLLRTDTKGQHHGQPAVIVDRLVRVDGYRFPAIRVVEKIALGKTREVVERREMVADHLLVNLAPEVTVEQLSREIGIPLTLRKRISGTGTAVLAFAVTSPDTVDRVLAAISEVSNKPTRRSEPFTDLSTPRRPTAKLVNYVEPDYIVHPSATPNDPRYADGSLWNMHNTGQNGGTADADVDAPEGWDLRTSALATVTQSRSGPNTPAFGPNPLVIAVVDTGIRYTHEDIVANMWTNPGEIPNNGIDDENNGVIDDVYGVDTIADNGDPMDTEGHGSHCAGTIAAVGNNSKGVAGIAWSAQIAACRFLGPSGGANSDGAEALYYAWEQAGADVISCSWGGGSPSVEIENQILAAGRNGAIVVFAAGNDATNLAVTATYPAVTLLDNVVTVASTTRTDTLSSFSNYAFGAVNIGAPGSTILSLGIENDSSYETLSGTSMATPLAAGIAGLLRAQFPNDTYGQIINRLYRSVDLVPALNGKVQTGGRVNLQKALTSTSGAPAHDDFATALTIPSATPWTIRSANLAGTVEPGEPLHAGLAATHTIWFKWTAPATGNQVISTQGSNYGTTTMDGETTSYGASPLDTVLAVYTGSALNSLTEVASNNDFTIVGSGTQSWSRVTFLATAGVTYYFAVGANPSSARPEGLVMLSISQPPAGDFFAQPILANSLPFTSTASNLNALLEVGEPTLNKADVYPIGNATLISVFPTKNGGINPGSGSIWWQWTPSTTQEYILSTSGSAIDTVLGIFTATNPGSPAVDTLNLVAQNDDIGFISSSIYLTFSRIRQTFSAGTTYYIKVDGFEGVQGDISLNISTPPPNDNIASATLVTGNVFSVNVNNIGASAEFNEPNHAGKYGAVSVWFKWVAPATQDYQLDTITGLLDTLLAVYTAADPNAPTVTSLTEIASNDDLSPYQGSYLRFAATAGTTYYFAVDGFNGKQGNNCSLKLGSTPGAMTNNDFADRIPLTGSTARVTSDLNGAHTEIGEPQSGFSVWWAWTAPASGSVTFTTDGSSYPASLAAFTGTSLNALTQVARNVPAVGQLTTAYGSISFNAVRGVTYPIAVYVDSPAIVGPVVLNLQLWTNPGEQGWTNTVPAVDRTNNGIDDDNNGLIDDTTVAHNALPEVTTAAVFPANTAYTDQSLTVSGLATFDAESDAVTVAYQWQSSADGSYWIDAPGLTSATLPANDSRAELFWRCRVSPSDPTGDGNPYYTNVVAIARRPIQFARHGATYSNTPGLPFETGLPVLRRKLVINEVSKGSGATGGEWLEILALRDLNMVGFGYTTVFRSGYCKNIPMWQNIPRGTLILIYNATNKSPLVPADDLDPFDDGRIVVSSTGSAFDNGSGGPASGFKLDDSYSGATGARIAVRFSDYTYLDSLCYEDITPLGVPPMNPVLPNLPAGKTWRYTGSTEDGNEATSQWELGNADASFATPGQPNTELNSEFIEKLRAPAPAYRVAASNPLPNGLTLDPVTGQISGTINEPDGGQFRIAIERYAPGAVTQTQSYDLLVGNNSGVYTIEPGKTFSLKGDIDFGSHATLRNLGTLQENGYTITQKQSYATWAAAYDVAGGPGEFLTFGIANQLAFALILDPANFSQADLPVLGTTEVSGSNYLTLTFRRQKPPHSLLYIVESSPDLTTWTETTQQVGSVVSLDFATEQVTLRDTVALGGASKRFLRLRVVHNPLLPPTPTEATAVVGTGDVLLQWTAAPGADFYSVKRSITSGGPYVTIATGITGTSYHDSSAATNTTYYYVITATSEGESAPTAEMTVNTPASWIPSAPTGLGVTSGFNQITLSWDSVASASSYTVRRSLTPGGPYTDIASGLTNPSFNDTTAPHTVTCYYVVAAVNGAGTSINSAEISAATLPYLWTLDANGNWSTPANWGASSYPNGTGVFATLGSVITTGRTITLDADVTLGSLTFTEDTVGANAYTFNIGSGRILTFDVASGQASLTARCSGGYQLGTQGGGSIQLADTLTISAGSAQSATTESGTIAISSQLTGPGGLVVGTLASNDGSGTAVSGFRGTLLRSTVANNFAGGVVVNSGYLKLAGNIGNLGSGSLTLNSSDSSSGLGSNLVLRTAGGTLSNPIILNDVVSTGGSPRIAIGLEDTGSYILTGAISGSLTSEQVRLTANSTGTLRLQGNGGGLTLNNTTFWIRNGTVILDQANALSNGNGSGTAGALQIGESSNNLNAASLLTNGYNVGGNLSITSNLNASSGPVTLGGQHSTGTATFSGPLVLNPRAVGAARVVNLTSASGGVTVFGGVISDGTLGANQALPVNITGTGTVLLNGANTYTGTTTVNSGATLGGTGLARSVTVASGGKLTFHLSTTAGGHDKFDVAGALVFSGSNTLTISKSGGATTGVYTLVSTTGGVSGTLPTLSLPAGWAATLQVSGNDLTLNVTSAP